MSIAVGLILVDHGGGVALRFQLFALVLDHLIGSSARLLDDEQALFPLLLIFDHFPRLVDGVECLLGAIGIGGVFVGMNEHGELAELLLARVHWRVGLDLEDVEWIQIGVGRAGSEEAADLLGARENRVALLNLLY